MVSCEVEELSAGMEVCQLVIPFVVVILFKRVSQILIRIFPRTGICFDIISNVKVFLLFVLVDKCFTLYIGAEKRPWSIPITEIARSK